jgi:high affinity sulfate transporter 1
MSVDHPSGLPLDRTGGLKAVPHWLRNYRLGDLRSDVSAGLIAAAVVIPMALAYATIAELPVQAGLYTAFVPTAIYALFGSSRTLSVSSTTTLAVLTGTALSRVTGGPGASVDPTSVCATLALLVGAVLVIAGLLRLGFIAHFISEPVLIGFKAGIGVVIVVDQLPKLLGIHFQKGHFVHNLLAIVEGLPHMSLPTVGVGVLTLLALLALRRWLPGLPAPLVAVAGGIAATSLVGLEAHGVATIKAVPTGLPPLTTPNFALMLQLWPAALGIALMSFTETVAAGRAFAPADGPAPEPNRELTATGLANAGGAFLGALPAGGGTTQTTVNSVAGARTQLAGLVTAALALGTMLLLAPFIHLMPEATLAAVVIVYASGSIKPAELGQILAVRHTEFAWALVALSGVVLLGTLEGIEVAVIVSFITLAYQVHDPPVHVLGRKPGTNVFRPRSQDHASDVTIPGLLLLRLEGRIFFANAERIANKVQPLIAQARPKVVALDLGGVFDLEYTALKMLTTAEKRSRENGVTLWLVSLNPAVLAMVQRSPLGASLGRQGMFFNLEQAIARYEELNRTS